DPDMSMEVGRDAPAPRPVGEDLFSDQPYAGEDLNLDLGEGVTGKNVSSVLGDQDQEFLARERESSRAPEPVFEGDTAMGGMDERMDVDEPLGLPLDEEDPTLQLPGAPQRTPELTREATRSPSPLSEARSSVVRELEEAFEGEEEGDVRTGEHGAKRRRVRFLPVDEETFLSKEAMKRLREDRSGITRRRGETELSFDPVVVTLREQRWFVDLRLGGMLASCLYMRWMGFMDCLLTSEGGWLMSPWAAISA
ncbi:sister chromatid cohesion protein 1, partial [Ascosphaera atra]